MAFISKNRKTDCKVKWLKALKDKFSIKNFNIDISLCQMLNNAMYENESIEKG